MRFQMSPYLNYATVHTMQQTSTLSSLCNYNVTVVVLTESLMPFVAARALQKPITGAPKVTPIYVLLLQSIS